MSEVTMPRLSDTMQEGTISHWLKHPGDEVKKGDILAEIETDKATMELESYETDVLEQILVQEGETVRIPWNYISFGGTRIKCRDDPSVVLLQKLTQLTTAQSPSGSCFGEHCSTNGRYQPC